MEIGKIHRVDTSDIDIEHIRAGDIIDVKDSDDAVQLMYLLSARYGIETDFVYIRDGVKGLWLMVTGFDKGFKRKE